MFIKSLAKLSLVLSCCSVQYRISNISIIFFCYSSVIMITYTIDTIYINHIAVKYCENRSEFEQCYFRMYLLKPHNYLQFHQLYITPNRKLPTSQTYINTKLYRLLYHGCWSSLRSLLTQMIGTSNPEMSSESWLPSLLSALLRKISRLADKIASFTSRLSSPASL